MSDIIHLLPDSIANQIAAGEVIQRPASVVKELVENAIDAGATSIRVYIRDAGKACIQVIDNGKGMSETDARMSFERHATSKISSAADLFALKTMGFRGEALASIAAVAQVELRTRLRDAELGTHLTLAGSVVQETVPDNCDAGSNFSVKNLFFNVPVRRKFLKGNDVEFRHIINEFERIALVNPQLQMSLYRDDTEIFSLPDTNLRQRIVNVFGKNINQKLLPVDIKTSLVAVSGFIGRPDASKKKGCLQYFFVNGRYMKHSYFHKAIMTAYEHLIPSGEMPDYFIYLSVEPDTIDVNIHPTKTEIKFENEQPVWQILRAAVKESLGKSSSVPAIDFDTEGAIDIPVYGQRNTKQPEMPTIQVDRNYDPFRSSAPSYRRELDWESLYADFNKDKGSDSGKEIPMQPEMPMFDDSMQGTQVTCLQYGGKYIITTLKSGLAIIDQHRAHICILYGQYLSYIKQQKGISQKVLFPEIIELTASESSILPSMLDTLTQVGFDLSPLGNQTYSIYGIPAGLEKKDPVTLLKDMLAQALETGKSNVEENMADRIALSLAKAAAIPYGKPLSDTEMSAIIASLFSIPSPTYTPNGKLVLHMMTTNEIEKIF